MGLFRKSVQEDFIIVAISSGQTMDVENNGVMVSMIEASRPAYWQLMNPDGYTVFFKSAEAAGRGRAEAFSSQVQALILADKRFDDFKIGLAEGRLVTQINWTGRICFPPLGGAVNAAYKNQQDRQDLRNQPSNHAR